MVHQLADLVPSEHELKRIGPIHDTKTYLASGQRSLSQLRQYANLAPEHSVMDVGCGFGRVAIQMLDFLKPDSTYLGLDIVRSEIDWCTAHITPRNPRFLFRHLDVQNSRYNPDGGQRADQVRFPVPEGMSFDLVFLYSVFTHMLPADVRHYLAEIRRHLKPGGVVAVSFFLVNDESRALTNEGRSKFRFKPQTGGYYAHWQKMHEGAVAYDDHVATEMIESAGLARENTAYGKWAGRPNADVGQDLIVARRPR